MSRRLRIGPDKNGNFAVKVALPGFDAYEDDDSLPNRFSYSSNWNDLIKPHAVGIISTGAQAIIPVNYPSIGTIPFVEVHGLVGTTFWDDRDPATGSKVYEITATQLRIMRNASVRFAYVVFDHR